MEKELSLITLSFKMSLVSISLFLFLPPLPQLEHLSCHQSDQSKHRHLVYPSTLSSSNLSIFSQQINFPRIFLSMSLLCPKIFGDFSVSRRYTGGLFNSKPSHFYFNYLVGFISNYQPSSTLNSNGAVLLFLECLLNFLPPYSSYTTPPSRMLSPFLSTYPKTRQSDCSPSQTSPTHRDYSQLSVPMALTTGTTHAVTQCTSALQNLILLNSITSLLCCLTFYTLRS